MTARLTAGQRALREAARLEAARVYGGVVPEHRSRSLFAEQAEIALRDAMFRLDSARIVLPDEPDPAIDAIRAGSTVQEVMDSYGLTYAEVRALRKQTMSEGVA